MVIYIDHRGTYFIFVLIILDILRYMSEIKYIEW